LTLGPDSGYPEAEDGSKRAVLRSPSSLWEAVMFPLIPLLIAMVSFGSISAGEGRVRDLTWFLQQMRSLDQLPALEASHTAMSSTWDRTGANADGSDYKRIESDGRNVLLDVDGPNKPKRASRSISMAPKGPSSTCRSWNFSMMSGGPSHILWSFSRATRGLCSRSRTRNTAGSNW
jgi:hypothetical protein